MITFGIPVYNATNMIRKCLDSIYMQMSGKFEVNVLMMALQTIA